MEVFDQRCHIDEGVELICAMLKVTGNLHSNGSILKHSVEIEGSQPFTVAAGT